MTRERDVLVIGGGVIGVCSAYYLAQRGLAVTLVEKADIAAGSSYGNSGLIVPSHAIPLAAPGVLWKGIKWMRDPDSPFYIRPRLDWGLLRWLWHFGAACTPAHVRHAMPVIRDLSFASLALYRELAALPGLAFGFHQDGAMAVYRTEQGYADAVHESRLLADAGITTKLLDGPAAQAAEPALRPGVVGGLLFPEDAHLVPDAFVTGLARVAEGLGVRIQRATEVLALRSEGRRIVAVETTRGPLEADTVVLAAGAWSPGLGRTLGLDVPIQPAKGYSITYERPAHGPRIPLLLSEVRIAVTPMGERLRFGGTLELAGLDLAVSRRRVGALARGARRYLAVPDRMPLIEIWRGLRPCTPDGLPMIGRPRRFENLVVAAGHAMIGMSLGPITGKLVSQLVAGETPAVDVSAVSPDRF